MIFEGGGKWEVEDRGAIAGDFRWLEVEFFVFVPTAQGLLVSAMCLVDERLEQVSGRLRKRTTQ